MSPEQSVRSALLAHAPLLAMVPAARISLDAVLQGLPRPYIALTKQTARTTFGLDNTVLASTTPIDILCVGTSRASSIAVRELAEAALLVAGLPWSDATAGYDGQNDIEAEVLNVEWMD
jgi:hypothetical protein